MKNAAGDWNCKNYIPVELALAGINVVTTVSVDMTHDEVPPFYTGELNGWTFRRAWYYWICSGPKLPLKYATPMHALIGQEVRVQGHCGCPAPEEYCLVEGGVDLYHIDTQEGLNIFAAVLNKWKKDVLRQVGQGE